MMKASLQFFLIAVLAVAGAAADPGAAIRSLASADAASLGVAPDAAWTRPPATPPSVARDEFKNGDLTTSCRDVAGKRPWRYCVTTTAGSSNRTLLYFLHGHGHDAENWANSGDYKAKVRRLWKDGGFEPPVVVSVSFGGFWLLIDRNQSKLSGLLEFFKTDVMPTVERDLAVSGTPRRLLFGESMGGFNAAQVVMKYPGDFARAVLTCPAVANLSPYPTKEALAAYKSAPGVTAWKVSLMLHLAHKVYKTEAEWRLSDPFTIGKTLLGPRTPPLLISSGDRDQYGLYKSDGEFASLAKAQGVDVTYTPLHGGHCSADPESIARFLSIQ
ncbi:MAG: alpha/beta fold hydrolase [Elusimicrobiota bacterium]